MWHPSSGDSPVIRTDFTRPPEWAEIVAAIAEPRTEHGFAASVTIVDDRAFDGVTPSRLLEMVPADARHGVAFLVDATALTHPDRPVLVVNLGDGATFRVVPSEMWSVQNNLSLANMDWAEFADNADDDGIFRGFA